MSVWVPGVCNEAGREREKSESPMEGESARVSRESECELDLKTTDEPQSSSARVASIDAPVDTTHYRRAGGSASLSQSHRTERCSNGSRWERAARPQPIWARP